MAHRSEQVRQQLFLGVDLGTTSLKVGVFSATGEIKAFARCEYELESPHPGWVEQSASTWWHALRSSLQQVLKEVAADDIAALSVVGQGPTLVCVDEHGSPLYPAITWADRRSVREAAWLSEVLGDSQVNVEFDILPRVLWIRNHEPTLFDKVRWFFQAYDYLTFALTGRAVTINPLRELPPWTEERLRGAELGTSRFPPVTVDLGTPIGHLSPAGARATGLSTDTLVVAGTVDAFAHWVGAGLESPGSLCDICGTSEGVSLAWPEHLHDPHFRVFSLPSPLGGGWIAGGSMSNGGLLLDWAIRSLYQGKKSREEVLDAVAGIPPGAARLLALPYFLGERTPIFDAAARGCFFGVTADHTAAHFSRALLEGVAFGIRQVIEILEGIGGEVREIIVTGGGSQATIWNQIKADVTNRPVQVPVVHDSGVLGAAVLAHSGAEKRSLKAVARDMVRYKEVISPVTAAAREYDRIYPLFGRLYQDLRGAYRRLAEEAAS